MRITAVTCVKNEGPFILEWIAFNRLLGVSDHLMYSNDCTDGTDRLLDALAARGLVRHLPNPAQGRSYQMGALKDARKQDIVADADWVWIADVDEFLNILVGDHTIQALIDACGDPQAISINFQYFANGGIEVFEDRPVIEQFTRSHNPDLWCGEKAIEVKSLVRGDFPLKYYGAHRPFAKRKARPHWTDGSGRGVLPRFLNAANPRRIRRFPAAGARKFATLNHYALRSLDSFLVKVDRGDANRESRAFDETYWRERNDPAWQDRSIQRHLPALRQSLEELKKDPEIKHLHDETVKRHKARRDVLLRRPEFRRLRDRLRVASLLPPQEEAMLVELGLLEPTT